METPSIFLSVLLLVLLVNACSADDLKVNGNRHSEVDSNLSGTSGSNGGSNVVANSTELKDDKGNIVNNSKVGIPVKNYANRNTTIKQSDSKKTNKEQKSNDVSKKSGNNKDSDQLRKGGTQVEECDSSNKCMDENKQFVACLRVSGKDSPDPYSADLSLLIQNKVKGSITVTISAPAYVQLEKTKVLLQEKGGDELKVSVRSRGTDNKIIIMVGSGNCSLDFRDIIAQNLEEFDNSLKSRYFNFLSQRPTLALISFAALLILASGCMCVTLRWRQFSSSASKYQRLDMDLRVTSAGKSDSDTNNGWDNSWGDDWDDEEAPKTPSLPVTPSLSSKGLASRRLNKEGWKD